MSPKSLYKIPMTTHLMRRRREGAMESSAPAEQDGANGAVAAAGNHGVGQSWRRCSAS